MNTKMITDRDNQERTRMSKNKRRGRHAAGFTTIELLILLIAFGGVLSAGYFVYHSNQRKNTASITDHGQQSTAVTPGTTQSIDANAAKDAQSESSIDSRHSASDQTDVQSVNTAANGLGGAYDESSL
jgi:cytoskeletal protein RodZ